MGDEDGFGDLVPEVVFKVLEVLGLFWCSFFVKVTWDLLQVWFGSSSVAQPEGFFWCGFFVKEARCCLEVLSGIFFVA